MTKKGLKSRAVFSDKSSEGVFPGGRFRKGPDPRRCLHGRKCKTLIEFEQRFKRELARQGDVRALVRLLWERALQGREWAIQMVLDRALGRPAIHAEIGTTPGQYRIVYADPEMQAAAALEQERAGVSRLLPKAELPRPFGFIEEDPAPSALPAKPADDDDDIFETEVKNDRESHS